MNKDEVKNCEFEWLELEEEEDPGYITRDL